MPQGTQTRTLNDMAKRNPSSNGSLFPVVHLHSRRNSQLVSQILQSSSMLLSYLVTGSCTYGPCHFIQSYSSAACVVCVGVDLGDVLTKQGACAPFTKQGACYCKSWTSKAHQKFRPS